jgi:DNA repair protein RAD5
MRLKHVLKVSDTIEGQIIRIQERKTALTKEAFRGGKRGEGDSESLENLKIMFGQS